MIHAGCYIFRIAQLASGADNAVAHEPFPRPSGLCSLGMTQPAPYTPDDFSRFRAFLRLLAERGLDPRLSHSVDASDIVQTVLLRAMEAQGSLRAQSEAQVAAWLRAILRNTLTTVHTRFFLEQRKLGVRVPIDPLLEGSSTCLQGSITDSTPLPPALLEKEEAMLRLVGAIEKLSPEYRQVVVLKHWHHWSIADIARHMGRTESSIAGLFRRGIARLGNELKET